MILTFPQRAIPFMRHPSTNVGKSATTTKGDIMNLKKMINSTFQGIGIIIVLTTPLYGGITWYNSSCENAMKNQTYDVQKVKVKTHSVNYVNGIKSVVVEYFATFSPNVIVGKNYNVSIACDTKNVFKCTPKVLYECERVRYGAFCSQNHLQNCKLIVGEKENK